MLVWFFNCLYNNKITIDLIWYWFYKMILICLNFVLIVYLYQYDNFSHFYGLNQSQLILSKIVSVHFKDFFVQFYLQISGYHSVLLCCCWLQEIHHQIHNWSSNSHLYSHQICFIKCFDSFFPFIILNAFKFTSSNFRFFYFNWKRFRCG